MLKLSATWQEAPGVRDSVLSATWARLEISETTNSHTTYLSQVLRLKSQSLDRAIYGTLFPLAEWIVENWWFLLYEGCRVPELISGRHLEADARQRGWLQRHNMLSAKQGGALPDLTIYRDGEAVVLKLASDPPRDESIWPVRFIEEGTFRIPPSQMEEVLQEFVNGLLTRLIDHSGESVTRLRAEWQAVCESRQKESELCSWSAALGLDPYNEEVLTDELIRVLESRVSNLPPELRSDLIHATRVNDLETELQWLGRATEEIATHPVTSNLPLNGIHLSAHKTGYQLAMKFRETYALPDMLSDLPEILHAQCGWPAPESQKIELNGVTKLSALVATSKKNQPVIIGPPMPAGNWGDRFRLARSLFFRPEPEVASPPRLVTRGYTWDQRASRAFAAELLAPACILRNRLGETITQEELDGLSEEFGVRPNLIEHQIRNHNIACIVED